LAKKRCPPDSCDQQAQQTAQGILRYFDTAGQFHHQDEEGNSFPTLLALDVPNKDEVETLIDRLPAQPAANHGTEEKNGGTARREIPCGAVCVTH